MYPGLADDPRKRNVSGLINEMVCSLKVTMVCLEDGIMACGFRKFCGQVERLIPDARFCFVSTGNIRSPLAVLTGKTGSGDDLGAEAVDEMAQSLAQNDLLGFSSMTGYAELTRAVIKRVREINPTCMIIWGGIHPIIQPEDAIEADVDAICTGEGEFAFEQFYQAWKEGGDYTSTCNFWFKDGEEIIRNGFLPLQTSQEMETLPFARHAGDEFLYERGKGFRPMTLHDRLRFNGLSFNTVWSIGCPFKCTYCGNTKFIENDVGYRKLRHPSARYAVAEIKAALAAQPYLSTVCFHDDSFMAIPYDQLAEFAEIWREEVGIPFAVYGVIPNYVRQDKLQVLTWGGMNRIRMGVQSGSKRILDFYQRPTPPEDVLAASKVCAEFAPKYQIPPAYDIIVDNPIETRQDVIDTLEMIYAFGRPLTLNIYSLKAIPNTNLEKTLREAGVDIEEISSSYINIPPRWANLVLYLLVVWRPPRWLFDRLLKRVRASGEAQPMYPVRGTLLRGVYLSKRAIDHLRHLDFSTIPGYTGYLAWKIGLVEFWWKRVIPKMERPARPIRRRRETLVEVVEVS
jgi:anaerobic magnesium-protoporphyrin IX monomethyl ester cyclase